MNTTTSLLLILCVLPIFMKVAGLLIANRDGKNDDRNGKDEARLLARFSFQFSE